MFVFALLAIAAVGAAIGTLLGYEHSLPPIQSLEDYRPDVITDVFSDDSKVIGEFAVERRIVVNLEDIPVHLQLAILAAEDAQFYNHSGVDYLGIIRAAYRDLLQMRAAEGASTITQQLARMLLRTPEKTFDRKIKELLVTWKIEKRYSKRQILTLYCNQHYMGHGAYGVAAAADTYFGKQLKDLTLDECAMIAGLPRSPLLYSPRLHPDAARSRRNHILNRMVEEKMISETMANEAKAHPLSLRPRARDAELAPYFVEWVRQSLADRFETDVIWRKGLRVYTTLNIAMQEAANRSLREGLRTYDKRHGWRAAIGNILKMPGVGFDTYSHPDWRLLLRPGDITVGLTLTSDSREARIRIGKYTGSVGVKEIAWTGAKSPDAILKPGDLAHFQVLGIDDGSKTVQLTLDQIPEVQGALLTLDNSNGEIKAMVGGYDFAVSEFNRATQALRQVGSTFKPFVYATALEKGMTPDSTVVDSPISYTDQLGRVWRPVNYDGKFKGTITLRQALTESRNVPTIRIASLIGIKNVLVMARRFGLSGPLEPYLPLAIGACEATPLEMATAFAVFPNIGMQPKPYFIRRIEDYDRVKKEETRPETRKVLEPDIAMQMLELLQNVVEHGTATAAKSLGRPLGGKTGTTNDFTDAWFVGFSPSYTTAVWVGFETKKTLGNKEAGAVVALPIWIQYMAQLLKDRPVEQFATQESLGITSLTDRGQNGTERGAGRIVVEDLRAPVVKKP
jgi:penicillin-binding protein 1A